VTVSDLHFNPLYDSSLYPQLANADPTTQWAGIYQGSRVKAPTGGGTDTNYPLLALTLASIQQNIGSSPVVLFTGDLLGHNIPLTFCNAYYASLSQTMPANCATSPDPTTAGPAMQQFINNTFTFVATEIRAAVGNVPVIYVPGNIDAYLGGVRTRYDISDKQRAHCLLAISEQQLRPTDISDHLHARRVLLCRAPGIELAGHRAEQQFLCGRSAQQWSRLCGAFLAGFATFLGAGCRSESVDSDACAARGKLSSHRPGRGYSRGC
jgi:hypothetical protein